MGRIQVRVRLARVLNTPWSIVIQDHSRRNGSHSGAGCAQPAKVATMTPIATILELLCARFPLCFAMYEAKRRPLKLRIDLELLAVLGDEIEPRQLSRALGVYTGWPGYLRRMRAGEPRIGLDGAPAGGVTADEARYAADKLAKWRARERAPKPSVGPGTIRSSFSTASPAATGARPCHPRRPGSATRGRCGEAPDHGQREITHHRGSPRRSAGPSISPLGRLHQLVTPSGVL